MLRRCQNPRSPHLKSFKPCYDACWAQPNRPSDCATRKQLDHDRPAAPPAKGEKAIQLAKEREQGKRIAKKTIKRAQRSCDFPFLHGHTLEGWAKMRRPPPSEYTVMRGSQKGTRIDEVPASCIVKYLILQRELLKGDYCTMLSEAMQDSMKRHPKVKSQAGPKRTKKLEDGILKTTPAAAKRAYGKRYMDMWELAEKANEDGEG